MIPIYFAHLQMENEQVAKFQRFIAHIETLSPEIMVRAMTNALRHGIRTNTRDWTRSREYLAWVMKHQDTIMAVTDSPNWYERGTR